VSGGRADPRFAVAPLRRARRELGQAGWQLNAITTDNGAELRSFEFQDVASELGIEQRFIRAARPQTNGAVERVQRTILEECWRPASARSPAFRYTALRRDLQSYLALEPRACSHRPPQQGPDTCRNRLRRPEDAPR